MSNRRLFLQFPYLLLLEFGAIASWSLLDPDQLVHETCLWFALIVRLGFVFTDHV